MKVLFIQLKFVVNIYISIFTIALLLTIQDQTSAQTTNNIKGKALNSKQQPVEFATVSLLRTSDSLLVKGALTDIDGNFQITDLPPQNYILYISHIEYKPYYQKITLASSPLVLSNIEMDFSSTKLDEVVVKGSRILIERKIDRVVFNVNKSITASTGNALDAVGKSPGVRVDFEGNMTVNGKKASILINNRPLNLSPAELNDYLKNVVAQNIERIEIMSNPSSAYDAKNGAIINIITKKNSKKGVYGGITTNYQQGQAGRYLLGASLRFNTQKFKISNSYAYRNATFLKDQKESNAFQSAGVEKLWSDNQKEKSNAGSHVYKLNLEYLLNKNHIIGGQFTGAYNQNVNNASSVNQTFSQNVLDSVLYTGNDTETERFRYSFNLNYEGRFGTKGGRINVDLNMLNYQSDWNQNLQTSTYNAIQETLPYAPHTQSQSRKLIGLKTMNIDYKLPLGEKAVFSTGVKLNQITTDNNFAGQTLLNGAFVNDVNRTNHFVYTENTQAVYIDLNWTIAKHELKLGLRGEATQTEGNSISLNQINKLSYEKLFPTFFWLYAPNNNNSISLSYRKAIGRPSYWRVNPFKFYSTPLNYSVGNPMLRPMLEDALELTYTFANQWSITGFYNTWTDEHSQTFVQETAQTYYFEQINMDRSSVYGFYLNIPQKITSWWETSSYLQVAQTSTLLNHEGSSFENKQWNFFGSINNSFVLSKKGKLTAEITGWYSSPDVLGIYKAAGNFDVSLGIRKVFAKGRASVALAVSDMFYSQPTLLEISQPNQLYSRKNFDDTRTVRVSFTYRFKKGKVKRFRQKNNGSQDEQNRLGGQQQIKK